MLTSIGKATKEDEEGFTLIELLVVIVIIGILAAMSTPVFLNQRQKGWDAGAKATLRSAATAEETHLAVAGSYTLSRANLRAQGFKRTAGVAFTIVSTRGPGAPSAGVDSFCLRAVSQSGAVFHYDSAAGGLLLGAATCF